MRRLALICLVLTVTPGVARSEPDAGAAEGGAPDLALLEYLGQWEGDPQEPDWEDPMEWLADPAEDGPDHAARDGSWAPPGVEEDR